MPASPTVGSLTTFQSPNLWPVALITTGASNSFWQASSAKILPQVLHSQYASWPSFRQVASTFSTSFRSWPSGSVGMISGMSSLPFSSAKRCLQISHVQYASWPGSVQVAAFASVLVRVCGSISMVCSLVVASQFLQWIDLLPVVVQVGSLSTV